MANVTERPKRQFTIRSLITITTLVGAYMATWVYSPRVGTGVTFLVTAVVAIWVIQQLRARRLSAVVAVLIVFTSLVFCFIASSYLD